MPEPTISEVARDLAQLEARVERERKEMLQEIRGGFTEIKTALHEHSSSRITRDVYDADQRRLDGEIRALETGIKILNKTVVSLRGLVVSSFLLVVASAAAINLLGV